MQYVFPCILIPESGGYSAIFPDIPGGTQGKTLYEALTMAEEMLAFMLATAEEDGDEIPIPTPLDKVEIPAGGFLTLIKADIEEYLRKNRSAAGVA